MRDAEAQRAGEITAGPFLFPASRIPPLKLPITPQYVELLTAAHTYMTQRQDVLRSDFGLASMPRAHLNEATGQLVFSDASATPRVLASVQIVGSVDRDKRSWIWSWADPDVDPGLCKDVREVQMLGETRRIERLTTPFWEGDAVDGWEMTSITAYVLQAKGAYRAPTASGFTYMVMTAIERIPDVDG
jgi:hypothetical protein